MEKVEVQCHGKGCSPGARPSASRPETGEGLAGVPLRRPGLALLRARQYGEKQAPCSAHLLRAEFLSLLRGYVPPTHPQFFRG